VGGKIMPSRDGRPLIAVTVTDSRRAPDPTAQRRKNALYLTAGRRAGGRAVRLDASTRPSRRDTVLAAMDGLLLSGGPDLDPALYGERRAGSVEVNPGRDEVDLAAWAVASARRVPVLGICRGLQAINVFLGGRLVQHVDGHRAAAASGGVPVMHALKVVPGSRLGRILLVGGPGEEARSFEVNSFHHQAIRAGDLAPGLAIVGTSPADGAELVEAAEVAEAGDGAWWVVGVQCHPERRASTPPEFERLFRAFVDSARSEPSL
jgi:putative glutamine amidotransferase